MKPIDVKITIETTEPAQFTLPLETKQPTTHPPPEPRDATEPLTTVSTETIHGSITLAVYHQTDSLSKYPWLSVSIESLGESSSIRLHRLEDLLTLRNLLNNLCRQSVVQAWTDPSAEPDDYDQMTRSGYKPL